MRHSCPVMRDKMMVTILTSMGRIIIPEGVPEALGLVPRSAMTLNVNASGDVVVRKLELGAAQRLDRVERSRGQADVEWRTEGLMALLRDDDCCTSRH